MSNAFLSGVGTGLLVFLCNYLYFGKIIPKLKFLRASLVLLEFFAFGFVLLEFYFIGACHRHLIGLNVLVGRSDDQIFFWLVTLLFLASVVLAVVIPAFKMRR